MVEVVAVGLVEAAPLKREATRRFGIAEGYQWEVSRSRFAIMALLLFLVLRQWWRGLRERSRCGGVETQKTKNE